MHGFAARGQLPEWLLLLLVVSLAAVGCSPQAAAASPTAAVTETTIAARNPEQNIPTADTTRPAQIRPVASATNPPPATATERAPLTATRNPTSTPSRTPRPTPSSTVRATTPSTRPATRTSEATPSPTPSPTATATATPLPPIVENEGFTMLLVPGDHFVMGVSADALAEECRLFDRSCDDELLLPVQPQHPVRLDSFYIDAYEVTNEAYASFLDSLPAGPPSCMGAPCLLLQNSRVEEAAGGYQAQAKFADHPVHSVTWYGAAAFCEWRGARLPTEAEWEMAASWQAASNEKTLYPWGNRFDGSVVNFCDATCTQAQSNGFYDDGYPETAPVGSYPGGRSAVGAYEMAGNVWEWVADWFSPRYYEYAPEVNPQGPGTGVGRVLRGGSWFDTGNFAATVFRIALPPGESNDSIGFRCALSPQALPAEPSS